MYLERRSPAVWFSLLLSAVIHISFLLIGGRGRATSYGGGDDMIEVNVLDRYDITQRPQVAKVLSRAEMGGGGGEMTESQVAGYAPQAEENIPTIDLQAALDRGPSQARIELDRYELDRSGTGMDVVYLGGQGSSQSTDQILAQPALDLSRGGPGGPGRAGRGIPGVPQPQAQISIEHRALAKPAATALPQMAAEPV
ncbi:hypothetical protein FJY71_06625, partial [candidate division WOR-3 bacterium]|nr:hypothetical protein [candidate division WOR-3 bacterium]